MMERKWAAPEDASLEIDLNEPAIENAKAVYARSREYANLSNNTREASGASTPKKAPASHNSSSNDAAAGDDDDMSVTEKHDCDMRQDDNTQELEYTSAERRPAKRFDSDIDGVGTAVVPDGEPTDTERVPGTESPVGDPHYNEQDTPMHKCSNEAGETMPLDVETQPQENLEPTERPEDESEHVSPSRMEDTETGTLKTADLLASEVAGSWAISTAPSVIGENESQRSMEGNAGAGNEDAAAAVAPLLSSHGESQSNVGNSGAKMNEEHRALSAMIDIVAPDFRQQFEGGEGGKGDSMSDAETEDGGNSVDGSHDDEGDDETHEDAMEDEDEAVIEDSVG